jgi:hypothetical protein
MVAYEVINRGRKMRRENVIETSGALALLVLTTGVRCQSIGKEKLVIHKEASSQGKPI